MKKGDIIITTKEIIALPPGSIIKVVWQNYKKAPVDRLNYIYVRSQKNVEHRDKEVLLFGIDAGTVGINIPYDNLYKFEIIRYGAK
jgi:hypothetical protein